MRIEWKLTLLFLFYCLIVSLFVSEPISSGSTYSSKPQGTEALFEFLKKDKLPVSRWEESTINLSELKQNSTLLLITPKNRPSLINLTTWVEKGNRLILFLDEGYHFFLDSLNLNLDDTIFPLPRSKNVEAKVDFNCYSAFSSKEECAKKSPWLKGVNSLTRGKYVFSKYVSSQYVSSKSNQDEDDEKIGFDYTQIPVLVKSLEESTLKTKEEFLMVLKKQGKGEIMIFPDASIIQNQNIDKADNFRLLYNLLKDTSAIYFDEFSHGFKKPLTENVKNQVALIKFTIGALFFTLVLTALSRAVRFGLPREENLPVPDASLELINIRGELYEKYSASSALNNYVLVWKERAARKSNLSSNLENKVFLEKLSQKLELEVSQKESLSNSFESLLQARDDNTNSALSEEYSRDVKLLEKFIT